MKITIDLENASSEFRSALGEMADTWKVSPEALVLAAAEGEILRVFELGYDEISGDPQAVHVLAVDAFQIQTTAKNRENEALRRELKKRTRAGRVADEILQKVADAAQSAGVLTRRGQPGHS